MLPKDEHFMILGYFDLEDRPNTEIISYAETEEQAKADWELIKEAIPMDDANNEDKICKLTDGTEVPVAYLVLTKIVKVERQVVI